MPMMEEWTDEIMTADRADKCSRTTSEVGIMALNESQIKINDILAKGCYILVGVDPTGKENLRVHACNVPMNVVNKIVLGLAIDLANRDDLAKRDLLAAAASIAHTLQAEEAVTSAILRPN